VRQTIEFRDQTVLLSDADEDRSNSCFKRIFRNAARPISVNSVW